MLICLLYFPAKFGFWTFLFFGSGKTVLAEKSSPRILFAKKRYHSLESISIDHAHPAVRAVFLNANAPIVPPFLPRGCESLHTRKRA